MDRREQLLAWRSRWTTVNRLTEREHGVGDASARLRILDRLYLAAPSAGPLVRSDEEGVWRRMQTLRHRYRADT